MYAGLACTLAFSALLAHSVSASLYAAARTTPLQVSSSVQAEHQMVPHPAAGLSVVFSEPLFVQSRVIQTQSSMSGVVGSLAAAGLVGLAAFLFTTLQLTNGASAALFRAVGRRSAAVDPIDICAPTTGEFSMLSTTGVAEAEAPPTPATPAVTVERSYAKIIERIEKKYLKDNVPNLRVGDTVIVGVRIREGEKERVQDYQGVIIAMANHGLHKSITVRAVLQGVGVERVFPVHAPQVASLTIVRRAKVRRAKLYYLRDRQGKSARLKQKFEKVQK